MPDAPFTRLPAVLQMTAVAITLLAGCAGAAPDPAPTATTAPVVTASPTVPTGVDRAGIEQGIDGLLGGGERYDRLIKSVVVQVGGEVVAEHYAADSGPEVTHDVFSVTKSVMSMLIGIAIGEGTIPGVDATLAELLPDRVPIMAPGMGEVTLHQILTMTGGLPEDEMFNDKYHPTADWTALTLSTDLVQPAGIGFIYASSGSHLLSAILVEATGRTVLDFAREKLFDPLGIVTRPANEPGVDLDLDAYQAIPGFAWTVDPTGLHVGSVDIKLAAPDMATLGQLYLQHGAWNGTQLVPADWVATSTQSHVDAESQFGYGYQWRVFEAGGHPAFAAMGRAGQLIEVVPDLDLVVAVSCLNDPAEFDGMSISGLVTDYILPAVSG